MRLQTYQCQADIMADSPHMLWPIFRGWRREHQPANHETKLWYFLQASLVTLYSSLPGCATEDKSTHVHVPQLRPGGVVWGGLL